MDELLEFRQQLMMFLNCNSRDEYKASLTIQQLAFAKNFFKEIGREIEIIEVESHPITKKTKCILKKQTNT